MLSPTMIVPKEKEKIRLVYILAASHSGSTLLAMLMGSHPEACTVGELKLTSLGDVRRYRCSCLEEIRNCGFWSAIGRYMEDRGFPFDVSNPGTHFGSTENGYLRRLLRPLHRGRVLEGVRDLSLSLSPEWRRHLKNVQARNVALLECIRARTGKKVIVDSSKIGLRLKYLLRNPELDVCVVRLIRDGRAVALTYANPSQFADARDPTLRGGGTGSERPGKSIPIAEGAREWRRSNEEAEEILGRIDESRRIEIRYESLCTGTDEVLRRLFAFAGIDPAWTLADLRNRRVDHHVVGNGMRLDFNTEVILDERWKSVLSESDLKAFNIIAGATNRRLGYG